MRVGLQIPNFTWDGGAPRIGEKLAEIVRAADQGGFYSIWVMDHFFQIGRPEVPSGLGPPEDPMLESYSTLAFIAAHTQKVKLGALVTGVVYRHPGVLIKTATTLDVLSGGRAYLGIGAAWNEREARGLGVPFPPLKERFERLDETIQIALQMWSPNNGAFHGRHYSLEETLCSPQPLATPHPPIMIGGTGETKTLPLVAKYADACNLFARLGVDVLKAKLEVLKRACDKIGRDYATIERTSLSSANFKAYGLTAKDMVDHCHLLAGLGFTHAIFNMAQVETLGPLETFIKEIIPEVAGL